jgi:hypothetical protein
MEGRFHSSQFESERIINTGRGHCQLQILTTVYELCAAVQIIFYLLTGKNMNKEQTPWFQAVSELYRPTERPPLVGEISAHFSG